MDLTLTGWLPDDREPGLLAHRDDNGAAGRAAGRVDGPRQHRDQDRRRGGGRDSRMLGAEDRRDLLKQKVFRRARRTLYVLVGLGIVAPIVGFFIMYQIVSVPDPKAVAATLNQPITIYYVDNSVMTTIGTGENAHQLVPTAELPRLEDIQHAVEAAEDATFRTNAGVDLKAILRTAFNQATGGSGGASTITQEYIKQATDPGVLGSLPISTKIAEMVKAYKMSRTVPKPEIMAAYLNIVYFGRGAYGIGAAAKTYFNTTPDQLTTPQAALLAGLIQSPGRANSISYQEQRFTYVMDQMAKNGWLQPGEGNAPLPALQPPPTGAGNLPWDRQLIVQQVKNELQIDGLGIDDLQRLGARIYTTIRPTAQQDAENSVQAVMAKDTGFTNGGRLIRNGSPVLVDGRQIKATQAAALVSIDPTTGGIVAWYGGNDPNATEYDMADTPHQPGSSFKPYVFASALQNDPRQEGLNTIYDGSDGQRFNGHIVHNSEGEGDGPVTVKTAMTQSINTVFYAMGLKTGVDKVRATALQAGIPPTERNTSGAGPSSVPSLENTDGTVEGGISIGQYPVRPRDQAQGYATLANYGNYVPSHFVTKVTDGNGATVYTFNTPAKPAFGNESTSNSVAHTVIDSMTDVASADQVSLAGNRPVAAKTGTQGYNDPDTGAALGSYDSDAWMVGFTPGVVTAVWIGHYDGTAPIFGNGNNPEPSAGGESGYNMFGREDPSVIWKNYMDSVLADQPARQFANHTDINGQWNFVTGSSINQAPPSQGGRPHSPSNNQPNRPNAGAGPNPPVKKPKCHQSCKPGHKSPGGAEA